VGVIDAGYRGEIKGAFRNTGIEPERIQQYTRMLQICEPTLKPFFVEWVDSIDDETTRGEGGFGSTGL
jgi:dUTPase